MKIFTVSGPTTLAGGGTNLFFLVSGPDEAWRLIRFLNPPPPPPLLPSLPLLNPPDDLRAAVVSWNEQILFENYLI